jgi:hypothetical protein
MPFFLPLLGTLLGGLATSAIGSALSPKQPKAPGYGELSAAGAQAEAEYLPIKRALESASALGAKAKIPQGQVPKYETKQMVRVRNGKFGVGTVPYVKEEWDPGGKYHGMTGDIVNERVLTGYEPSYKEVDFTGHGEIDTQAEMARRNAAIQLELQKKYGEDFVRESVKQAETADPEGADARNRLFSEIEKQAGRDSNQPLANELESQIRRDLLLGKRLGGDELGEISKALMRRGASGDPINPAITNEMEQGLQGQNRLNYRQGAMQELLSSGTAPNDIRYRRGQQNISNYGAYLAGITPQAQFQQLSGAQRGASPFITGPGLSRYTGGLEGAAVNMGANNFQQQSAFQSQQANPWFAGLGLAIKGAGAAGAAGWKPFGR